MKESDKNIEKFIGDIMTESNLESPSTDFTSKVMLQILVAEKSKIKTYKPLISKSIWMIIGCGLVGLAVYASLFSGTKNNLVIENVYSERISTLFSEIHLSKNILYAVLVVPFMILVQIPLLKNYYDKKYQL